MRLIKRITAKTVTIATVLALFTALIFGAFSFRLFAFADDEEVEDTKEYTATSMNISNPNFSDTSGSYKPTASPSSWTGNSVGGGNGGSSIIAGVVDLTSTSYHSEDCGNEGLHLDQYPEYSSPNVIPQTIFGSDPYGGDKKTLIVNTKENEEVAYAFASSDMTFSPNSFYRVSAWVKTGNFAEGTGATIKLTGLGENCAFININTVKNLETAENGVPKLTKANNYGWVQYTFYVRTSASMSKTVKLSLGIGDAVSADEKGELPILPRTAHGYAFFDSVAAHRISSYQFAFETNRFKPTDRENVYMNGNDTAMVLDLYEPKFLTTTVGDEEVEIGTFSNATTLGSNSYWNPNVSYYDNKDDDEDIPYVKSASADIYDTANIVDLKDDDVHFTKNPWAPLGRAEFAADNKYFKGGSNGNVLRISANNGPATRGVASPDVTVERFKFYRMSVWIKGDGVTGGDGISVLIKGQNNVPTNKYVLHVPHTLLSGDASDTAHYGWKEHAFYIQGSSLSDLTLHFEFWLGSPTSPSEGIALFDNVTFTELTQSEFNELSGADGGAITTLDPSSSDTGVTNGNFITLGSYDDIEFPLPVSDWTYYDASNVGTNGFSTKEVDTENVIHGMIPADHNTFEKISGSGALTRITDPSSFALAPRYNALLLSSSTPTAVCYRSSSITAAVDKGYKLTVDMAVDGVSSGSYGAALVLKTTGGSVLSTIEGIKSTGNAYKPFTFYINAPLSEKTVYVEVWLGLNDRVNNKQKLSDGNVYVKQVAMTEWVAESGTVADEYASILEDYKVAISSPSRLANLDYGVVSFTSPSLDYYDAYTYQSTEGLGIPYNWSVTSANSSGYIAGLFDNEHRKEWKPYPEFDSKDQTGRMLYIYNTVNNRTIYTYGENLALVSNTYYRLDVTLKVKVSDEIRKNKTAIGAGINLTGTVNSSFENIKDTTTLISSSNEASRDYETFKTYTFYISTGASGGNVGLNISFGGDNWKSYITGKLIISDVSLTSMTQSAYEESTANLTSQEKKVELSKAASNDDDNDVEKAPSEVAWWLIPTLIFSICLIAAIAIIIVIRVRDHLKKKKKSTYTSEYDRAEIAKRLDRLASGADDMLQEEEPEEKYFDTDDGEAAPTVEPSEEGESDESDEAKTEEKPAKSEKKAPADDLDD
ncbi:MAG: hypothetical protein J1G38_07115 [Clostridiales bacterium]|nr:hypothetical protein [Clostridiales bacterium]